jgi:glycogen synthase
MIAMRYGCVPLARATGGLKDTIQKFQPNGQGSGFLFKNPNPEDLSRRLTLDTHPEVWQSINFRVCQVSLGNALLASTSSLSRNDNSPQIPK